MFHMFYIRTLVRPLFVSMPPNWNTLPMDIRTAASIPIFKKKLKTYLFNLAFKLE
ncbi:hypothetical protein LDENG_00215180 [Lucifuga dentata]|nr:hypothetical protein LDENG_00215180 [Lucifuga dentata]